MQNPQRPQHYRPEAELGLVTSVRATGRGLIILAGPSSCGKGAVADALRRILQIPRENHLAMGDALRGVIARRRDDAAFRETMGERFGVWPDRCVYDPEYSRPSLIQKAREYSVHLEGRFGTSPSQADWLEYCVTEGLLVPDAWSEAIIDGTIEERAQGENTVVLLDGYPRTEIAARHILRVTERLSLPILKILHLSVSKREMHRRALGRNRLDDTPDKLERRFQFYIEHVQPCVELLKSKVGSHRVALIDAHQPSYNADGKLNLQASVNNVAFAALRALGVSRHILRGLSPAALQAD